MGLFIGNFVKNRGRSSSIRTGLFADRPAIYANKTFYVASDTQEVWYRQGDAWRLVANVGGLVNPGNLEIEPQNYNADATYVQNPFYILDKIVIIPGVDAAIKVGTTAGGEEVFPLNNITTANGELIEINQLTLGNPKSIYFTGLPAATTVYFIKIALPNNGI